MVSDQQGRDECVRRYADGHGHLPTADHRELLIYHSSSYYSTDEQGHTRHLLSSSSSVGIYIKLTVANNSLMASLDTTHSSRFESEYKTNEQVSIDEAMIPFKGRLGFKHYMKDKHNKWGIKVFVLSDATNGSAQ